MKGLGFVLSGLLAFGGCVAPSAEDVAESARARCATLRDHVVDLRLKDATGIDNDLAAHRAAMLQGLGSAFVEQCVTGMSVAQVTCSLDAADLTVASACLSVSP